MPWQTPTLEELRGLNRDNVQAQLRSGPMIPNSVMRVMADSNAGLAYLVLLYINWLALQLMPDTAETEWLDRFATIWKPGGAGRKTATFAGGVIQFTGSGSVTLPAGASLTGATHVSTGNEITFSTLSARVIAISATNVDFQAAEPGETGLSIGSQLTLATSISGINSTGTISAFTDGIEEETDDELRVRVIERIQQPPVGGDAEDYVQWTKATIGVNVTRAWCAPLEMGIGTLTVRFMTDDLVNNKVGFPSTSEINTVTAYLDTVRPVCLKDRFVLAPLPEPIFLTITNLTPDTVAARNAIAKSIQQMLYVRAAPAHAVNGIEQPATTVYAAWVSDAIMTVPDVESFTLIMDDHPMPYPASLAVLGSIVYA